MSRINKLRLPALALTVMLLVGVSVPVIANESDNELYFEAIGQQYEDRVNTTVVRRGEFNAISSCKASIVYDDVAYVFNRIDSGTVTFEQYLVRNGSYVHTGDPIAEVKVSVENIEIEDLAIDIAAEEENLEKFIDANKALLKDYSNRMVNAASASERRTAELLYNRLSVKYEKERADREGYLGSLRNTLNAYEEMNEKQYIYATMDGTVSNINRYRKGDKISGYSYMCSIYNTENIRFRVYGGNEQLTYDMPVVIAQGAGSNAITVAGRVSSSKSPILSPGLVGSDDYIEVVGDPTQLSIGDEVAIRFNAISTKDALMVNKQAVKSDSKGSYVYVFKNGMSVKRYIFTGGVNTTDYWVIDGLEEGDVVVVK